MGGWVCVCVCVCVSISISVYGHFNFNYNYFHVSQALFAPFSTWMGHLDTAGVTGFSWFYFYCSALTNLWSLNITFLGILLFLFNSWS